jgi:hypothetical protein
MSPARLLGNERLFFSGVGILSQFSRELAVLSVSLEQAKRADSGAIPHSR